jgi:DNA polymerase elongation subunit (family B)
MYGSVYYDKRASRIHWSEYDKKGIRTELAKKWAPDFYIDPLTGDGDFRSQDDLVLTRVTETTFKKRNDQIKMYKDNGRRVYGSDLSPENKFILEKWPQDLTDVPDIRYMFIDIETECESGFPNAEQAKERVNLITCWSTMDKKYHTFGLEGDFDNPTDLDVTYVLCRDEDELLCQFIKYVERTRHDIWSGWNSSGFDVPYLFNRILRILDGIDVDRYNQLLHDVKGDATPAIKDQMRQEMWAMEERFDYVHRLSHFGKASKQVKMIKDNFTKEMKPQMAYSIEGVTDYDYLKLDQQFGLHKRDSYKLDNVARDELGESKLEYEGTMKEFYKNEWNRFVEYNIQDVRLLVRLNEALNYIPQAIALSYKCHCLFRDNFGTVTKVETAVYNFLYKDKVVMDDRGKMKDGPSVPGGYVTPRDDLRRGMHKWVIDVDIASLYPSLMRGINISYDTKVAEIKYQDQSKNLFTLDDDAEVYIVNGDTKKFTAKQVREMVKKKDYHVSSRNVIFKNVTTHRGVLVKMLDMWYAQRKADKKLQAEYRDKALEIFTNAKEVDGGHEVNDDKKTKHLSDEDFAQYEDCMRLSGVHFNLQWSCKILLNSVYGCIASKFSRFYGEELASSVTLSGRTVIKRNGEMLNDYFNNEFWDLKVIKKNFPNIDKSIDNVEARLYTDTDSVYLTFDRLMDKLNVPVEDDKRLKTTRFLAKIAMNKLEEFNETFFEERFNAPNNIFWDQELIARTGIWCQPKKYVCHILEEDGKPPKEDMLKKGLDIVRSSIPRKFKKYITTAVDMILKEHTEKELQDFIHDLYKEFKTWSYDEIAIPVSCNNLSKWGNIRGLEYVSGTPQHMKAAIAFNYYLEQNKLKDYEPLGERDKFKMIFLGKNMEYTVDTMGYKDKLPTEFNIEHLINLDAHFERGFIKPLSQIFDAVKWQFPDTKNISLDVDDLFE